MHRYYLRGRLTLSTGHSQSVVSAPAIQHCPISQARHASTKQRIVVVGSGWAGFTVMKRLDVKKYDIVVISPRSYFVFTPLLASTAVGTLEFRCALESVRASKRCSFHEAKVLDVDFENQSVNCTTALESKDEEYGTTFAVPYDKLILTPGCYSNTFNIPGVKEYAHFLKDVKDARGIRSGILKCFEEADLPTTSEQEKDQLLSFCIVGGGPTGIEFAAELHDLIEYNLKKLYPALSKYVSIDIYDVADHILGAFDQKLGEYATQKFARSGIRIHTRQSPTRVEKDRLIFDGNKPDRPYGLLVWSTGLQASPLITSLTTCSKDERTGSLITNDFLQVQRSNENVMQNVYALGDCAVSATRLPATAQVASQKAEYLAKALNGVANGKSPDAFVFKNRGIMAFLGGRGAIVQAGGDQKVSGFAAYIIWKFAYFTMTVSLRNKILIPIYWALNGVLGRDINRF